MPLIGVVVVLKAPDVFTGLNIIPVTFGPNVTGEMFKYKDGAGITPALVASAQHGALSVGTNSSTIGYMTAENSGSSRFLKLDASQSNLIYTDNGHVYPLSLALNYIIKD